jgi:hypothetical protein
MHGMRALITAITGQAERIYVGAGENYALQELLNIAFLRPI